MRPVVRLVAIVCSVPLLAPVAADAASLSGLLGGGGFARGGAPVRAPVGLSARPTRNVGGLGGGVLPGPGRGTCFFGSGCGTPGPGFGPGYGLAVRNDPGVGRSRRDGFARTGFGYGGYGGYGGGVAVGLAYDGFGYPLGGGYDGYGAAGGFPDPGPVYGTPPSPVSSPAIYVIGRAARPPARARTGGLRREPGGVRVVSLSGSAILETGRIVTAPR